MLRAVGNLFGEGLWYVGSVLTNPTDGTVLVDSGALTGNQHLVGIAAAATVPWVYDIQHRDSANATNLHVQRRRPAAGNEDWNSPNKVNTGNGDRIRIVLVGNVTGEIQVGLFLQEVA